MTPIVWRYAESDPGLMLFTASVDRFGLTWPCERPRVLELGCAETDFAERLTRFNPSVTFTGVDARAERSANGWTFVQGDARDRELFQAESFDVVLVLGALEHFGLGFYGDPVDGDRQQGDIATMRNIAHWLTAGGWVYFDVPCNPTFSLAANRHFRTYAPADVTDRLMVPGLVERCRGYSDCEPHAGVWLDGPPTAHKSPYHYVAVVADSPASRGALTA